jgi:hypothetical protein
MRELISEDCGKDEDPTCEHFSNTSPASRSLSFLLPILPTLNNQFILFLYMLEMKIHKLLDAMRADAMQREGKQFSHLAESSGF